MTNDRDHVPDGVPHAVVGLTAFYAFVGAVVLMWILSHAQPRVGVAIATIWTATMVSRLGHKSVRERDQV